jgi:aryl-alcohol dehydrogenase-like predicted oxidoreductase
LFSPTHDILRYGFMLANDGKLDGKRYLSHAAMDELRKEQTGATKVNYSLGYRERNQTIIDALRKLAAENGVGPSQSAIA